MTDLGGVHEPPVSKGIASLLVLGLVGALAFLGWAVLRGEATAESPYPASWDKRVAPYVTIVEKERGYRFQHPVDVRFLSAKEFKKSVRTDAAELSGEDREEIEQSTGFLRALGLISGDVDLVGAANDANSGLTLAYYSFEDRRITVRGTDITPATRSTLVHELTHALQDQHFGIAARYEELQTARDEDSDSDSTYTMLQAIVEGDAKRIEARYRQSLGAKAQAALDRSNRRLSDRAVDQTASQEVPEALLTILQAPYVLGEGLVETVAADGGNRGVDALIRTTPSHEDVLLDPFLQLTGQGASTRVKAPDTSDGEETFDEGEFGVLGWYLLLAERVSLRDALAAVDGWAADAYVAFERDEVACVRVAVTHDSAAGTDRMRQALRRWVASSPGSQASVDAAATRLVFETCDPGAGEAPGNDTSQEALQLVAVRTALALQLLRTSMPHPVARCAADRLVGEYSVEQLTDPTFGVGDPAVAARSQQIVADCS